MPTVESRILVFDGMRGCLAVLIAAYHFRVGGIFQNTFIDNSWIVVDFFFVLSGFFITLKYGESLKSSHTVIKFFKQRFLRLYPLHILMLMVFLGFECGKAIVSTMFDIPFTDQPFSKNNFLSLLSNSLFMQGIFQPLTWNYPSWSLTGEFICYGLAALTFWQFRSNRTLRLFSTFIFCACSTLTLYLSETPYSDITVFRAFLGFSLGSIVYELSKSMTISFKGYLLDISSISILLLVLLMDYIPLSFHFTLTIIFAIMLIILVNTNTSSVFISFLESRSLVRLGELSYSVYMIHAAVWVVLNQFVKAIPFDNTYVTFFW